MLWRCVTCGVVLPVVHSAERVTRSVDESLARLGIDYIDVIQIHDPEFAPSIDIIINETLPALIKVKESGKVKMVGMTGYPMAFQREIVEKFPGKLDTVLSYCHYSMNDYSLIKYGSSCRHALYFHCLCRCLCA